MSAARKTVGLAFLPGLSALAMCLAACSGGDKTQTPEDVVEMLAETTEVLADIPLLDTPDAPAETDVPVLCPEEFAPCTFCKEDSDCVGVFPGLSACAVEKCGIAEGYCMFEDVAEGTSCSDGDACNGAETCKVDGGILQCAKGVPLDCDDGDFCNGKEACDPASGCIEGAPETCDDEDDCTDDSCDPKDGCKHLPNGAPGCCEEDSDCDDSNPCTADSCLPATLACENAPADGACDDGDPCTQGDACGDGKCVPGPALPGCAVVCMASGSAGETVRCDIGLARRTEAEASPSDLSFELEFAGFDLVTLVDQFCLTPDDCTTFNIPTGGTTLFDTGHLVYLAPASPADWNGQLSVAFENTADASAALSQAYYDVNETLQGESHLLGLELTLLDDVPEESPVYVLAHSITAHGGGGTDLAIAVVADGLIVTSATPCGSTTMHCFDAFQCTTDVCDEDEGSCGFEPASGPCDDGNACTLDDQCDNAGNCVPAKVADAGTECAGKDLCEQVGLCDDAGKCLYDPKLSVVCPPPDGDCAVQGCNPKSGKCGVQPLEFGTACDDANACTTGDACDGLGGCQGKTTVCDDGLPCTADSCSMVDGKCVSSPDDKACDDGNPCTKDSCVPGAGCSSSNLNTGACDDGVACTTADTCKQGKCTGTWNTAQCGCTVTADCAALEDGDLCNGTYVCKDSKCIINPSTVVKCPADAGDCKVWSCVAQTGKCVSKNATAGASCNGGACLIGAACDAGGLCVGPTLGCDDGNDCTTDSCDPGLGCVNAPLLGCVPKLCVCKISGDAGSEVQCPFLLLRQDDTVPSASGADFELLWDPQAVTLKQFEDQVCMGTICLPKKIPTCQAGGTSCTWGSLYPSGHNIVAVPKDFSGWQDHGTLLFFHPSDPFLALTSAYLDAQGNAVGDPLYLQSKFTLGKKIPADDPVCLWMKDPHFSLANGLSLGVKAEDTKAGRAVILY